MRGRGEIFWGGDVAVVYIAPPPPPLSSSPNEKGEKEGRKKEEGCSFDFWWNSLELRRRRRAFPAERGGEMKRRGAEPYSTMRPLIREKPRTRGPRSIQSRKEEKWGAGGEKELSFLLPPFVCAKGPPFLLRTLAVADLSTDNGGEFRARGNGAEKRVREPLPSRVGKRRNAFRVVRTPSLPCNDPPLGSGCCASTRSLAYGKRRPPSR